MIKKILILITVVFLYSCSEKKVRIRSGKRVTVSGLVVKENDLPLSNIPITSYGSFENMHVPNYDNLLGNGVTAADGNFHFVSLDSNNSNFSIAVNASEDESYNPNYTSLYLFDSINDYGLLLTLNNLKLKSKSLLKLNLINNHPAEQLISYEVIAARSRETYLIEDGQLGEMFNSSDFYYGNEYQGTLDEINTQVEIPLSYVKNSDIQIKYRINEGEIRDTLISEIDTNIVRFEF